MYHSTKTAAQTESILKNGFENSDASNNMLGAGIYVSRSLEKAKRYGPITFKLFVNPGLVKVITKQDDPEMKTWQEESSSAWVPPNCGMVPSGLEVSFGQFHSKHEKNPNFEIMRGGSDNEGPNSLGLTCLRKSEV